MNQACGQHHSVGSVSVGDSALYTEAARTIVGAATCSITCPCCDQELSHELTHSCRRCYDTASDVFPNGLDGRLETHSIQDWKRSLRYGLREWQTAHGSGRLERQLANWYPRPAGAAGADAIQVP